MIVTLYNNNNNNSYQVQYAHKHTRTPTSSEALIQGLTATDYVACLFAFRSDYIFRACPEVFFFLFFVFLNVGLEVLRTDMGREGEKELYLVGVQLSVSFV